MFMLHVLLPAVIGAVSGAVAAAVVALLLLRARRQGADPEPANADPFVEAEIDQAAAAWAHQHGQPDAAAAVMADKLKLLHRLGTKRGWR